MKRVLLTGASGFIGRQCVPLLVAKGFEVHAVARKIPTINAMNNTGVIWHQADLLTAGEASRINKDVRPDCLLHMAWYAVPGKFWESPENGEWIRASRELFEAFANCGGKRIVAAGTCAEYQRYAGECVERRTPVEPTTAYGSAKHELQEYLDLWKEQTGVSATWGRIFHLYGPHEDDSRLVAYAITCLLRGKQAICSDGLQVLDFLHVQDVAAAFVALLESRANGAVNVASGRPVEVRSILGEIGKQIGRPELIRLGAKTSTTPPDRWWGNIERLTSATDWKPKFDLHSGISDAIQWWRSQLC